MTRCFMKLAECVPNNSFTECKTISEAKQLFLDASRLPYKCGVRIKGSIHLAQSQQHIKDEPDYILEIGERGGLILQASETTTQ